MARVRVVVRPVRFVVRRLRWRAPVWLPAGWAWVWGPGGVGPGSAVRVGPGLRLRARLVRG
ncbi:MAG: hypothetical protein P9E88_05880 [Candidatus Competibacter sp.]|nr:hypothetical protein [Candidatus Competibacter sp.]